MVFYKNIPQPGDKFSKSQKDLLTNNGQLNTSFGIDHYPFDDLTLNNGKHKQVSLVEQSVDPLPTSAVNDLYSKTGGELFYKRSGGIPIQMTLGNVSPLVNNYTPQSGGGAVGTNYSAGYTFLPGAQFYQYGNFIRAAGIAPSTITVKFPRTFTNASSIVVIITPICKATGTSQVHIPSLENGTTTTTQFVCNYDSSTTAYVGFSWIAIGI